MSDALKVNRTLKHFDLSENRIPKAHFIFYEGLRRYIESTHVDFSSSPINLSQAQRLGRILQTNDKVTNLILKNNKLGNEGVIAIADGLALAKNTSLVELDLSNNNIEDEGAIALARTLHTNRNIINLNLSDNNIGEDGVKALSDALKGNRILTFFDLSRNSLTDTGTTLLANALETNDAVTELNLQGNDIGDSGAIALAHTLESNRRIRFLNLANQIIGNDGALALITILSQTEIITLDLSNNTITHIPAQLSQCRLPTQCIYRDNPIVYIPPQVHRWLARFDPGFNTEVLYRDGQNVHNHLIQQCIQSSMYRILNERPIYDKFEEVRTIIQEDQILTSKCKTDLLRYANDTNVHTVLNVTFSETLVAVFSRISVNENGEEIKRILNQEMKDASGMCFTGRISRLMNCLTGMDPLVHIHIESVPEIFVNVGKELKRQGTYTVEKHRATVKDQLRSGGYTTDTPQVQAYFECIEDFA